MEKWNWVKAKAWLVLKSLYWILFLIVAAGGLVLSVKGCSDNIRQDQQDARLLERIEARTEMLVKGQTKCREIEKRLDQVESKLNEVGSRLSK